MSAIEELRARADTLFPRDGGLHPPSEVLLAWPKPNYVNPETRSWTGPIMLIVVLILTFLTFAARIWARIAVAKNAGLDDLFMTLAMLPLIGLSIAVILGITVYGFQWHAWDQTKKTFVTTRQITMAIEVTYMVSTTLIKISILCFYRRITSGTITKTFVYCVWASIAFVIAYGITFTCLIVFSCKPVEGYFRLFDIYWRLQNKLECHDEAAVTVAVAAVSTVQDFIICALPIFLVWNLHIPKTQKAALIGIFGLGLVTCVCGIMRTYYATYVYYYTYDITWYAFYGWIWTALEADLAVICASAPALKVFFKRYFNMSTNRSGYAYGHSSGNSRRTPYGKGTPDNSMGTSNMDNDGWTPDEVPLDRIKVNQVTDVIVEDRDEVMSQKSDTSTRLLTALPKPPSFVARSGPSEWEGCRTTCQAYRPGSRTSLKDDYDADIEKAVVDYRR